MKRQVLVLLVATFSINLHSQEVARVDLGGPKPEIRKTQSVVPKECEPSIDFKYAVSDGVIVDGVAPDSIKTGKLELEFTLPNGVEIERGERLEANVLMIQCPSDL